VLHVMIFIPLDVGVEKFGTLSFNVVCSWKFYGQVALGCRRSRPLALSGVPSVRTASSRTSTASLVSTRAALCMVRPPPATLPAVSNVTLPRRCGSHRGSGESSRATCAHEPVAPGTRTTISSPHSTSTLDRYGNIIFLFDFLPFD